MIRSLEKSAPPPLAIGRGVVGNGDFDEGDGREILRLGELSLEDIAAEGLQLGLGVVRIDQGTAHPGKIPDLHDHAPAKQVGVVGALIRSAARGIGLADAGEQKGGGVLVRGKVPLQAVEQRFGKGHRRQGGADLVAYGEGVVVLALVVGGHD